MSKSENEETCRDGSVESSDLLDMIREYISRHGYNAFSDKYGPIVRPMVHMESAIRYEHPMLGYIYKYINYNGWSKKRTVIDPRFDAIDRIIKTGKSIDRTRFVSALVDELSSDLSTRSSRMTGVERAGLRATTVRKIPFNTN